MLSLTVNGVLWTYFFSDFTVLYKSEPLQETYVSALPVVLVVVCDVLRACILKLCVHGCRLECS